VGSTRTLYRLLAQHGELRERRDQRRHPPRAVPRLCATAPNAVWSWDITPLPGPARGMFFQLYVMLDLFSRFVVAWMVALRQTPARLALRPRCRPREASPRHPLHIRTAVRP
jgi:putative transposase